MNTEAPSPWAEASEQSVLAAMMLDPRAVSEARRILAPEDFFREAHEVAFRAMCRLQDRGQVVDIHSVHSALTDTGDLELAGGLLYLDDLINLVPGGAHVAHHAAIVRERSERRRLIAALQRSVHDGLSGGCEATDLAANAISRIIESRRQEPGEGYRRVEGLVGSAMEEIRAEAEGRQDPGVPTGVPKLDWLTGGLKRGDLSILAARPSMGKTALALQFGTHAAIRGHSVDIASAEMSAMKLVRRQITQLSQVDPGRVRDGKASEHEFARIKAAQARLRTLPLRIDDNPGGSVAELRAGILRASHASRPDLVIVDYLQLLEGRGENRTQQVAQISRGLKQIAKELDCHVLALSQLSRGVEHRQPPRPQLSDLRDSGAIEQDADIVLMLWRPEYYFDDRTPTDVHAKWQGVGELILAKQRDGETGTIKLAWAKQFTTFTEIADVGLRGTA